MRTLLELEVLEDFAEWISENCYNGDLNKGLTNKFGVGCNCYFGRDRRGVVEPIDYRHIVMEFLRDKSRPTKCRAL